MRLTGSVCLTKSGIALATPSKLKRMRDVTAKPVNRMSRRRCIVFTIHMCKNNYYWGERSESLPGPQRRDFVCVSVCLSVMDRHPIFAFVTRDPYPFNFADELGVSNFAELAPHNALSIPLV